MKLSTIILLNESLPIHPLTFMTEVLCIVATAR